MRNAGGAFPLARHETVRVRADIAVWNPTPRQVRANPWMDRFDRARKSAEFLLDRLTRVGPGEQYDSKQDQEQNRVFLNRFATEKQAASEPHFAR